MIAIKVIVFFFALGGTIRMIEEMIMRIILASKEKHDDYRENFVHGHTILLEGSLPIIVVVLWTGFYLLNLL